MAMTVDEATRRIEQFASEWEEHLLLTHHQFMGIDFSYLAHIGEDGGAHLLTGAICLSTAHQPAAIEGTFGSFRFGQVRVPPKPDKFFDLLATIVQGKYRDALLGTELTLTVTSASASRGEVQYARGPHDRIEVYLEVTRPIAYSEFERFDDALFSGKALPGVHIRDQNDLRRFLNLPSRESGNGIMLHATIPRIGRLRADRSPTGETLLHVGLPRLAKKELATLVVHDAQDDIVGKALSLNELSHETLDDELQIIVPWKFGPSADQHVTLLFADRKVATCFVSESTPAAQAYLRLDPGCEKLRRALLPLDPSAPDAVESNSAATDFEKACGVLFALLGFHTTHLDLLKIQGDWHVRGGTNGGVELLVECSLRTKDIKKLKELEAMAALLTASGRSVVRPVVLTPSHDNSNLPYDASAAGHSVSVVRRDKLKRLLNLVQKSAGAGRTSEALDIMGIQRMIW